MKDFEKEARKILKENAKLVKNSSQEMTRLLQQLQKNVRSELGQAAIDSFDSFHLNRLLETLEGHVNNYKTSATSEIDGIAEEAWEQGSRLITTPIRVAGNINIGQFGVSRSSLETLKDFTFHKLDNVASAAMDKIQSEITMGVLGGKTPHEVAKAVGKNLKSSSIFRSIEARAKVIVQTETGRIFSVAAQERAQDASQYVDGLKKQWLHDGHPKVPRQTHVAAHEQIVEVDKPFSIGGVKMMFPRDPAAPLDEVIGCTCNFVPWKKEWSE